ncbi:MAG: phytanoyl-CoA dioxygenase family protein [Verrucomicrobiota bacterium]|nr:phytanoyl-CoA dioxygenase family protein [Verrucomicrobiota bacterium]
MAHSEKPEMSFPAHLSSKAVERVFHQKGFVSIENFLSDKMLEDMQCQVRRFINQILPSLPAEHVFCETHDDRSTLKQIQHLEQHDPWFGRLMEQGPFRQLAERLLHGPVQARNMQYFNKPPEVGLATPPHQDGYYFMIKPCEAVTMWLALDHVDEENGCVRYLPFSHQGGLRQHGRTTTLGFSQGITGYPSSEERERELAICAKPGDLLAHHALTIHRAERNRSPHRQRRALGLIFYAQTVDVDEVAHRAYQVKLKDELVRSRRI